MLDRNNAFEINKFTPLWKKIRQKNVRLIHAHKRGANFLGSLIIATRVGGIPEAVEEGVNGFLVPAGDHQAMAKRMIQLIDDGSLRVEMEQKGLAIVKERFSGEQMVRRVEDLYTEILSGRVRQEGSRDPANC